jgi:hypothetical protein
MSRREIQLPNGKGATAVFCRPCDIGIFTFDPAFNKWRDTDKEIPCPTCNSPIKWFARYIDGFFKGFCPKCKTTMKKDGDVKFGSGGNIIIPEDMEEDFEPPVQISIPVSKLKKLGKDKQNALANKIRRQREN